MYFFSISPDPNCMCYQMISNLLVRVHCIVCNCVVVSICTFLMICLFHTQQGCQSRHSDSSEWSMANYGTAGFNVDGSGSVSLQFSGGDDNR